MTMGASECICMSVWTCVDMVGGRMCMGLRYVQGAGERDGYRQAGVYLEMWVGYLGGCELRHIREHVYESM